MRRGQIWWVQLSSPRGSEPGYRRPVLIVQANPFNQSAISTVLCVAITSNLRLAAAPGNVRLAPRDSKLPKASVINVSQVITIDKAFLAERVSELDARTMLDVDAGLQLVLGLL